MTQIYNAPAAPPSDRKKSSAIGWIIAILFGAGLAGTGLFYFWRSLDLSGHGVVMSVDEKPSEHPGGRGGFDDAVRMARVQARYERTAREQAAASSADGVFAFTNTNRGITVQGADVKAGKTRLTIRQMPGRVNVNANTVDPNFVPPEPRALLAIRQAMSTDTLAVAPLQLTPAQQEKLAAIPTNVSYPLDNPTRKKIEAAFNTWLTAPPDKRADPAAALLALTKGLDAREASQAKADALARAAKIKAILTAEQLATYQKSNR